MNQDVIQILSELIYFDKFRQIGKNIRMPCPIHHGSNFYSFSIDLERGIWHCFSCLEGGSLRKLVNLLDPTGMMLKKLPIRSPPFIKPDKPKQNRQLLFNLTLDSNHPYLQSRNILPETIKAFGIGHCDHGMMKGRIAIPIYDEKGRLIAYTGRRIIDKNLSHTVNPEKVPKYNFPKGFVKSRVVYNYSRAVCSKSGIIFLTEGFFDVFKLHQYGYSAISVMGTTISPYQLHLIKLLNKHIIIFFDGDTAGTKGSEKVYKQFKKTEYCLFSTEYTW